MAEHNLRAERELRFVWNVDLRYDGPRDVLEEAMRKASDSNRHSDVVAHLPINEKGDPIVDQAKIYGIYVDSRDPRKIPLKKVIEKTGAHNAVYFIKKF